MTISFDKEKSVCRIMEQPLQQLPSFYLPFLQTNGNGEIEIKLGFLYETINNNGKRPCGSQRDIRAFRRPVSADQITRLGKHNEMIVISSSRVIGMRLL